MDFLQAARDVDPYDLARVLGEDRNKTKSWIKAAEVYFGPTRCTAMQRRARQAATDNRLSLSQLLLIETHAKKLDSDTAAWRLREKLCAHAGTFEQLKAAAKEIVSEQTEEKAPEPSLRVGKEVAGTRSLHYTGPSQLVTSLVKTLEQLVPDVAPDQPRAVALAKAFAHHLTSAGSGLAQPVYHTLAVMKLDDATRILSNEGPEVTIGVSDGTTITGAEWINSRLQGRLGKFYIGLFHPSHGGVNTYEARHANDKQRLLAMAENLVCPWPGCNIEADRCQVHHIDAYKNGGHTTPENLTMLCKYHNGVNNDDPDNRARGKNKGRVERRNGKVRYTSPGGYQYDNDHPVAKLGAMSLI